MRIGIRVPVCQHCLRHIRKFELTVLLMASGTLALSVAPLAVFLLLNLVEDHSAAKFP